MADKRADQLKEITERLEQADFQAEVCADLAHFAGAAVVVQQVIFKNLNPVKTRCGNGVELFRQGAAQGNSGD